MEIDEGRLRQQLRNCIAHRERIGHCDFYEELGSCYDCSWGHALRFIVGDEVYDQWYTEIIVELQPGIDALPPRVWVIPTSVGLYDPSKAEEVSGEKGD